MDESPQTPVYLKLRAIKSMAVRFFIPEGSTLKMSKEGT